LTELECLNVTFVIAAVAMLLVDPDLQAYSFCLRYLW